MGLECIITTLFMQPGVLLGGQNPLISSSGPILEVNKSRLGDFFRLGLSGPRTAGVLGWPSASLLARAWATTPVSGPRG